MKLSKILLQTCIILSKNIIKFQIDQLVLALPSRDYYLKQSSESDLEAYHRYMTQIAIILGANRETASQELKEVVDFEKRLANVSIIQIKTKIKYIFFC